MVTTYVLDTSAFIYGIAPGGEMETVPAVYAEVKDERSRLKLELLEGLQVIEPDRVFLDRVAEAARETGDDQRLSKADGDLLALALQEKESGKDAVLMTDDYAVQNVALRLGIPVRGILQRKARPRQWRFRCPGCNRRYPSPGTCPACGSALKRSLK